MNLPEVSILVADDDDNDLRMISRVLKRDGEDPKGVFYVRDGAEVLDFLHMRGAFASRPPKLPELMLLDLHMPRIDGWEVLRQIKTDPALKLMPVVIFSSSARDTDIRRSYELGANAYVVKPINYSEFKYTIAAIESFWVTCNLNPGRIAGRMPPAAASVAPFAGGGAVRLLLVEDDIADAELVKYALNQSGLAYVLERVDTREDFLRRLEERAPDIILSDYRLPSFDGLEALELSRQLAPDVPFIFVTGTLGEERAIETLKRGASDCVLKTRLSQLVPAVHRALREAGERFERKRTEEKLRESREQLRALSIYLQYVREEERTRIAREVHDELGQALTGLKMDLSWLAGRMRRGQQPLLDKIKSMSSHVDGTIQSVRRIATELRPGILDDLGLVAALEWQANEFQTRTGIQCIVTSTLQETQLDADLNTAFFRIFQETLTNVMRHANATKVEVRSTEVDGEVVLTVHDNGRGITPEEISDTRSIGLLGMEERAGLLGGTIEFAGEPGQGTTVTVRIPITRARARRATSHENPDRGRSRRSEAGVEANPRR